MDWTRRLRLQHLQLLVSLMETGNLSGTARAAHTTQPGLSKWLKELEEDVGAPLFERHARGLRPTPYGMTLFNHAQRVLTEMERARQNLEAMRSGSGSRVLLGTSPASAPSLVPRALRAFLGRYPGAQVELLEGTMNGLLERLEKRQLDVVGAPGQLCAARQPALRGALQRGDRGDGAPRSPPWPRPPRWTGKTCGATTGSSGRPARRSAASSTWP